MSGTKPYWTYLTDRETIAPASGNVLIKFPMLHLPGRDGHDLDLSMVYNQGAQLSIIYTQVPASNNNNTYFIVSPTVYGGHWQLSTPYFTGAGGYIPTGAGNAYYTSCSNVGLRTEDGASYSFGMASWGCKYYANGQTTDQPALNNPVATDDSGAGLIIDGDAPLGPSVYLPDGRRYITAPTGSILDVDANNNYITYNYASQTIVDTLGRTVNIIPSAATDSGGLWDRPKAIQYHDSNGVLQTITINYGGSLPATSQITLPIPTGSPVTWTGSISNLSQGDISSIVLPDGTSYSFLYDWLGELIKVGYPDGGYTRYDYGQFPHQYLLGDTGGVLSWVQMQVSAKHVCTASVVPVGTTQIAPGNTCTVAELTTTYQPTASYTYNSSNTVTEPDGTNTTYQFDADRAGTTSIPISGSPWTETVSLAPVETSRITNDASGNLLEEVLTDYESDWLHPSSRGYTSLYGKNGWESWSYSKTVLTYGGQNLLGDGAISSSSPPNAIWNVTSFTTTFDTMTNGTYPTLQQINKRHDYSYEQPGFNPNEAYFAGLKTQDYLFDSLVNGYTEQTKYGYDANTPTASGAVQNLASFPGQTLTLGAVRGNMTSQSHWSSVDNTWIGPTHLYDDAGNVIQTNDARGNPTYYRYADAFANAACAPSGGGKSAAYLTSVTNALNQTATATYYSCTGTKATATDVNTQTTTYTYWSPTDQLKSAAFPDGGLTSFCYDNISSCSSQSAARNFTISTTLMSPDPSIVKEEDYDGLGRSIASLVLSDPCESETTTSYDNRGRVYTKSFPFFAKTGTNCVPQASTPVTTYLYNGKNLPTSVQVTGSAAKTWTYSGQTVIETDENGNQIERTIDWIGRLASVLEPNSTGALVNETDYQYDAADNLIQVDQWGAPQGNSYERKRLFTYDTLSRLKTSLNPEAGTIKYQYDYNNNLTSEIDARNITTSRTYDALNRLTQTLYSDGTPTECFAYDSTLDGENSYPVGRETSEWTQSGACTSPEYSFTARYIGAPVGGSGPGGYDAMGRLVSDQQYVCSGECPAYITQYTYNKGGVLVSQTVNGVPVGSAAIGQTHDGAGRIVGVTSNWPGASQPPTILNVTGWSSCGMTSGQLGVATNSIASVTVARGYDSRCRTISETDTASAITAVPTVKATASILVSMNEQHTTPAGTSSTAQITFAEPGGTDQYSSACSCYETGIFTFLTDIGTSGQVVYVAQDGTGSTPTSIASGLVTSIANNPSSLVTATSSGPVLTITSKATGAAADYPFQIIGAVTNPNFTTPSFTASPTTGTMTGGSGGSGSTVYDSGTATATIGSLTPATISWTSADSSSTIATRLAAAITSADGSVVTASASGSQINVTAVNGGTAGDLSVHTSTTFNSTYFGGSSVTFTTPAAMTGGVNGIAAAPAAVAYQYSSGVWQDNGNLKSITDSLLGVQVFSYGTTSLSPAQTPACPTEHLNRLVGASYNGPKGSFTLCWSYDAFGNRLSQTVSGSTSLTFIQPSPVTYNGTAWASNNRVDGQNYDASGNLAGYRYDAASRITLAEGVCYLYDAEGRRVAKGTSLSGNVCENLTNIYVLGAGGEQLSEYDGSGNWKHTNVYGAGRLLATYDAAGTHFHLTDWLGTMRAQVSSNGVVDETCIDMPFGDDQNCSGPGVDATEHHFTGKVRDVETGFDYFGARYYASASGRWMSPDWSATAAPVPYAKLDYPQSLNLYAYVENNPLTMADADGHADAMGDPCLTPGCQQSTAADQEARKYDNQLQQNAEMKQASAVYSRQYEAAQSKARFAQAGLGYWQTNFTLDPGLGQLGKGANWDDEVYYKLKQDGHTPGGSYNLSEVIRPAGSDDSWNGYGTARDWDNVNAYDDTIRNNPFEGTSLIRQQYFIMSTEPGERPTHFVRVPVKIDGQLFWSQTITDFKGQVTITYHAEK